MTGAQLLYTRKRREIAYSLAVLLGKRKLAKKWKAARAGNAK